MYRLDGRWMRARIDALRRRPRITRGNQIRAADLLGVNRNTLRRKMPDLNIQVIRTGI
jgi:DNA-binding NtrC family response regulator